MTLISNEIEKVRAFELPCGIWADGDYSGMPRLALVKWKSCWPNMFHQVYVNGRYAGTTTEAGQEQLIVQTPLSSEAAVRIEVFAVDAKAADEDLGSELDLSGWQSGRSKISLLRSQSLPIGGTIEVYSDNGTGEIDYNNPFDSSVINIWPCWQDKAGFGMSSFGLSDFGRDWAAGAGFGKGRFGQGQFGPDTDTIEWTSPQLQAGVYKFAAKVKDKAGNESDSSETGQITVTPVAKAAEQLWVACFDKQTNQLVLNIS
jgi:hypothetical protein